MLTQEKRNTVRTARKFETRAKKQMRAICANPENRLIHQYEWAVKVASGMIFFDSDDILAARRIFKEVNNVCSKAKKIDM